MPTSATAAATRTVVEESPSRRTSAVTAVCRSGAPGVMRSAATARTTGSGSVSERSSAVKTRESLGKRPRWPAALARTRGPSDAVARMLSSLGTAAESLARASEKASAQNEFLAPGFAVPFLHLLERPPGIAILVTHIAGVRNGMADGVLGNWNANGVVADRGLDAGDGARHVAFHARTAGARFGVVGVCRTGFTDGFMAAGAESVGVGAKLRVAFDLRLMGVDVAGHAGDPAFQETLALPQAEGVVRKTPRAAVGPVGGVLVLGLVVFQDGKKEVIVIGARRKTVHVDVAKRVALRANHGVSRSIQAGLQHDIASRALRWIARAVMRHVVASWPVAAFAVGAEIQPGGLVCARLNVEVLLLLAHVAPVAALVPDLHQHARSLVRVGDVQVVKPIPAQNIPAWRQHDHAAIVESRQVMLDAAVAKSVVDAVFPRFTRKVCLGDVIDAVTLAQAVESAAQLHLTAREISLDGGGGRRLHHLAVARLGPLALLIGVAFGARGGTYKGGARGGVRGLRGRKHDKQKPAPDHHKVPSVSRRHSDVLLPLHRR